jgi:hypothetical protein
MYSTDLQAHLSGCSPASDPEAFHLAGAEPGPGADLADLAAWNWETAWIDLGGEG